jgi:hypothetical protein
MTDETTDWRAPVILPAPVNEALHAFDTAWDDAYFAVQYAGTVNDPTAIYRARQALRLSIARALHRIVALEAELTKLRTDYASLSDAAAEWENEAIGNAAGEEHALRQLAALKAEREEIDNALREFDREDSALTWASDGAVAIWLRADSGIGREEEEWGPEAPTALDALLAWHRARQRASRP